jgi:hypothetical protein
VSLVRKSRTYVLVTALLPTFLSPSWTSISLKIVGWIMLNINNSVHVDPQSGGSSAI